MEGNLYLLQHLAVYLSQRGVVSVSELLTNNGNLSIELVGQNKQEIEKSIGEMSALGVDIERMDMLKHIRAFPYNHFGKEFTNEDDTG